MFEEIKLALVLRAQSNLISKCVLASPCCSEKPDGFFKIKLEGFSKRGIHT